MQKTSRGHERTLSFKDKSHKVSAHFVTQVQKSSTEDSFEIKIKLCFFLSLPPAQPRGVWEGSASVCLEASAQEKRRALNTVGLSAEM